MREWYRPRDFLSAVNEQYIPEETSLRETVDLIMTRAGIFESGS